MIALDHSAEICLTIQCTNSEVCRLLILQVHFDFEGEIPKNFYIDNRNLTDMIAGPEVAPAKYTCKRSITHNILKNINGQLRPGRLTAVLGPSRAGKSTILNVLSGFNYITQDFAMLSSLTTRETLLTAADLKLGRNVDKSTKSTMVQYVDEILHVLELCKTKDTLAGKLSGGEKKRLSVGVELISNPPVMFLDEPTRSVAGYQT
ncbi:hypothetical protein C0J52_05064 [Blattella germanica]|nr:hypothetical protein C0J52_05064 [Blattella germanica]